MLTMRTLASGRSSTRRRQRQQAGTCPTPRGGSSPSTAWPSPAAPARSRGWRARWPRRGRDTAAPRPACRTCRAPRPRSPGPGAAAARTRPSACPPPRPRRRAGCGATGRGARPVESALCWMATRSPKAPRKSAATDGVSAISGTSSSTCRPGAARPDPRRAGRPRSCRCRSPRAAAPRENRRPTRSDSARDGRGLFGRQFAGGSSRAAGASDRAAERDRARPGLRARPPGPAPPGAPARLRDTPRSAASRASRPLAAASSVQRGRAACCVRPLSATPSADSPCTVTTPRGAS